MYQRIILVANLGHEPQMRYLPDGTAVTQMSVATSERWTTDAGEVKEQTVWFRVSVFGKQAETCNEYLHKGSRVLVEGRLVADEKGSPRTYTRKDGSAGASFEVRASTVRFLSPKSESDGNESVEVESEAAPF